MNRGASLLLFALLCGLPGCGGTRHVFEAQEGWVGSRTRWARDTVSIEVEGVRLSVQTLKPTNIYGIKLRVENATQRDIHLQVGAITLVDGSGTVTNAMEPDEAEEFIVRRNQANMFVMGGAMGAPAMEQAAAQARAMMVDSGDIPPGQAREGFVYFRSVPGSARLDVSRALRVGDASVPVSPIPLRPAR